MNPEVAEWFATWWPIWSPILLVVLGFTGTGIWVIVNRRGGERTARKNPLPPTWPEMWARIDAQDVRLREQDDRIDALEDLLKVETAMKKEVIRYAFALEPLIPEHIVPPARPVWLTT